MKKLTTIVLIALVAMLAGCSEEPTPTQVSALADKDGPPAEAGIIMRGSFPVGVTWVDFEAGTRVFFGVDINEFCAGTIDFELMDFQDANLPGGRIVSNGVGKMQTTVFDFLDFDCEMFTTIPPIAEGTTTLRAVDNDLEFSVVHNTNTWGYMAHGKLIGADGSPLNFNGFLRQQDGNNSGPKAIGKINLH